MFISEKGWMVRFLNSMVHVLGSLKQAKKSLFFVFQRNCHPVCCISCSAKNFLKRDAEDCTMQLFVFFFQKIGFLRFVSNQWIQTILLYLLTFHNFLFQSNSIVTNSAYWDANQLTFKIVGNFDNFFYCLAKSGIFSPEWGHVFFR